MSISPSLLLVLAALIQWLLHLRSPVLLLLQPQPEPAEEQLQLLVLLQPLCRMPHTYARQHGCGMMKQACPKSSWQLCRQVHSSDPVTTYLHSSVVDVAASVKGDLAYVFLKTQLSYSLSHKLCCSLQSKRPVLSWLLLCPQTSTFYVLS